MLIWSEDRRTLFVWERIWWSFYFLYRCPFNYLFIHLWINIFICSSLYQSFLFTDDVSREIRPEWHWFWAAAVDFVSCAKCGMSVVCLCRICFIGIWSDIQVCKIAVVIVAFIEDLKQRILALMFYWWFRSYCMIVVELSAILCYLQCYFLTNIHADV